MAYSNYLVKINPISDSQQAYTIPVDKFIKYDTYKITKLVQDLDSYRDGNGVLQRQALSHLSYKLEFETPSLLNNTEMETLFSGIRARYTNATERKVSVTAYVPEINDYVTFDAYMPDTEFKIYMIKDGKIRYSQTRLAFIGY